MIQKPIKFVFSCLTAFLLICAVSLVFSLPGFCAGETAAASGQSQEDLGLYAKAAALMDGETGRVLYGKNEKEFMPNASTTKILTCILAIENGSPDQICTASEYACTMRRQNAVFPRGIVFI